MLTQKCIGYKARLLALIFVSAATAQAANSLPVPANGVYLGIQANPGLASNQELATEILEGPVSNGINHTFALHLAYYKWGDIAAMLDSNAIFQPDVNLAGDISHGRVPVISWGCDQKVANSDSVIAAGAASEDAIITATVNALKQYPGPVLLRWFWEFNDLGNNQTCRGDTEASRRHRFITASSAPGSISGLCSKRPAPPMSYFCGTPETTPATRIRIRRDFIPETGTWTGSALTRTRGLRETAS